MGTSSEWTRNENKIFENSLVMFPNETIDRWQLIGEMLPGKSLEQIRSHYEALLHDIEEIESGQIELPHYRDDSSTFEAKKKVKMVDNQVSYVKIRKKGIAWTEEEHRLFLRGLETYGKGDWRSISRNFVITRSATQVASHAQKYFIRQSLPKKQKMRPSIHDITIASATAETSQAPRTTYPLPMEQPNRVPNRH